MKVVGEREIRTQRRVVAFLREALGVLELKRSTVSVAEGIRQNLDSRKPKFIQPFFATVRSGGTESATAARIDQSRLPCPDCFRDEPRALA